MRNCQNCRSKTFRNDDLRNGETAFRKGLIKNPFWQIEVRRSTTSWPHFTFLCCLKTQPQRFIFFLCMSERTSGVTSKSCMTWESGFLSTTSLLRARVTAANEHDSSCETREGTWGTLPTMKSATGVSSTRHFSAEVWGLDKHLR